MVHRTSGVVGRRFTQLPALLLLQIATACSDGSTERGSALPPIGAPTLPSPQSATATPSGISPTIGNQPLPTAAVTPAQTTPTPTDTTIPADDFITPLEVEVSSPAEPVDVAATVPLLGGTLLVTNDGGHAVLARPEGSQLVVVNLDQQQLEAFVELPTGSLPTRLIEDADQNIHVVLRGESSIASVHLPSLLGLATTATDSASDAVESDEATTAITSDAELVDTMPTEVDTTTSNDETQVQQDPVGQDPVQQVPSDAEPATSDGGSTDAAGTDGRAPGDPAADAPSTDVSLSAQATLRYACPEPRGLAIDPATEQIVVACRSGELVWLDAADSDASRRVHVELDLRDIAIVDGSIFVSTFKEARLFEIDPDSGEVLRNLRPNVVSVDAAGAAYEPRVAHRMLATDGALVVQHQRATRGELTAAYYSATDCAGGIANNTVSVLTQGESLFRSVGLLPGGSMLDIAVTRDGQNYAVLMTGDGQSVIHSGSFDDTSDDPCLPPTTATQYLDGHVTALAYDVEGRLLAQRRFPTSLEILGRASIPLGGSPVADAGLELFYRPTSRGVSCATCHPEGEEDGMTWNFAAFGPRRTQSVSGQVTATAPLHWQGDRRDMSTLLNDTLVSRMGGQAPSDQEVVGLERYLDGLPRVVPPRSNDAEDVLQGANLFTKLRCDGCHAGPLLTDNFSHDVGTGGEFQTPSLRGIAYRAPFMHDGCAATLRDRFTSCGGDERHGEIADLSDGELDQLVAYLESL